MKNRIIIFLWGICVLLTACNGFTEQTLIVDDTQIPATTDTTRSDPTDTPISMTDMALLETPEAAIMPGYLPQAWSIYPISEIGLSPPVSEFPNLVIYDLEEDQNGSMWFATSYGLIHYDGNDWQLLVKEKENKNIPYAYIEITPSGAIWFTIYQGIYQLRDGNIQLMLEFSDQGMDIYDLGGLEITMDGMVWIQLANDIWYFDRDEWFILKSENELPFIHVGGLTIDKNGRVYTWGNTGKDENSGSDYGGLALNVNHKWVVYDQKEQYGVPSNDMNPSSGGSLTVDDQDHVWFYLWRKGLFEYTDGQIILHAPYELSRYHPVDMVFDQGGTLWLGDWSEVAPLAKYVSGSGALQFIDDSYTFYVYDENDENQEYPLSRNEIESILPFEHVSALYVDSDNDLWIATELGIYVYDIDY